MSRKLSTAIVFAMAIVLAAAPFVLAQTSGSGAAPSGTTSPGATGTTGTTGTSSQMGTMNADTVNATVADVNHQQNTVKLRMQPGGETVEFKLPQASLSNLNKGDVVQVSIRKAEGQSGMGAGTQQPRPESSPSGSGTTGSGQRTR